MAGFQLSINGRIWTSTEGSSSLRLRLDQRFGYPNIVKTAVGPGSAKLMSPIRRKRLALSLLTVPSGNKWTATSYGSGPESSWGTEHIDSPTIGIRLSVPVSPIPRVF